ncbi:MAG: chromate transporter [Epulopiscium sp.]|nr:chromate transporter [Candidatus Epulonipiscium sp.]
MKIYLQLICTFFKLGLFSFGGGYAMIPLIEKEIESHGWMTATEFSNIIAIAEMTPGPIAVNSATFVGYKTAGILGGIIATIGVALPSLLLILLVSQIFFKYQDHPVNKMIFYGIRPVIVGLITTATVFVGKTAFFHWEVSLAGIKDLFGFLNFSSIAICIISFIGMLRFKIHPILMIGISAVLGVVSMYLF